MPEHPVLPERSVLLEHLVLMCDHPRVRNGLSRLVPALGEDGVARLQTRLLEQAATTARRWSARRPERFVTVFCQGGAPTEFRSLLGDDLIYEPDSGGSEGARLAVAAVRAFTRGADRVVLAGVHCPDLSELELERACFALEHIDCVIGPGHAGRYYLIGLVAPAPSLFAGMPWGTGAVLTRTLAAARQHGLRVGLMPTLPMLHGPGDLVHAARLIGEPIASDAAHT
jgi:glycosyltransferase A (GT-A) superfamily protein (DUF2064 family)